MKLPCVFVVEIEKLKFFSKRNSTWTNLTISKGEIVLAIEEIQVFSDVHKLKIITSTGMLGYIEIYKHKTRSTIKAIC